MNTNKNRTQQLRNPDDALWREIKAAAAFEGLTMTQWIEEAARARLKKKSK